MLAFPLYSKVLLFISTFLCAWVSMASKDEVDALRNEISQLKTQYAIASRGDSSSPTVPASPIYVAARKLDRFKDRPEKASDPSVEDWVADMRNHLTARNLTGAAAVACIKEHLTGKARLEIIGRGDNDDPEKILSTLLRVFGDGDLLPQL